jgi:putative flippase GtrA
MTEHKSKPYLVTEGLKTLTRFGLVGILATLVHICVVVGLSVMTALHPIITNSLAFCIAFIVSAYGHMRFTFHFKGNRITAIAKFFIVALLSLGVSNLVLYSLTISNVVKVEIAQGAAIFIVPIFSFLASKFWAFAES